MCIDKCLDQPETSRWKGYCFDNHKCHHKNQPLYILSYCSSQILNKDKWQSETLDKTPIVIVIIERSTSYNYSYFFNF